MTAQEKTGWTIIALVLLALWWLGHYGLSFLHGTSVQTTMLTGTGAQSNAATYTPDTGCTNCS